MSKVLLVYEDYSEMITIQSVLKKVGFDSVAISSEFSLSQQILSFNPDIVIGYGKGPKVSTVGVGRRLKEMPRWNGKAILIFPAGAKPDPKDLVKMRMDMALEAPLEVTRLLQVLAHLTGQNPQDLVERMMKAVAQEAAAQSAGRAAASEAKRDDQTVFVTGSTSSEPGWAVKGSQEVDEFNRLMGVAPSAQTPVPAPSAGSSERPAPDSIYVSEGDSGQGPETPTGHLPWSEVLEASKRQIAEKKARYDQILAATPPPTQKRLSRRDTKKAQRELSQDWNSEDLSSQDELRRHFTKALFKKKD